MAWLTGWSYRKSHVINYAAGAGTLYQKQITVHYGSGTDSDKDVYLNSHSRTDFGDVRFTDNDQTTLLDYWMESKVDSNNAVFWVEVADDLSTVAATIYVYYGKADATTTSNGPTTFIFFDDFNALNTGDLNGQNTWTADTSVDVQTTVVKEGAKAVQALGDHQKGDHSVTVSAYKVFVQMYVRVTTTETYWNNQFYLYEGTTQITGFNLGYGGYFKHLKSGPAWENIESGAAVGTWYKAKVALTSVSAHKVWINDVEKTLTTTTNANNVVTAVNKIRIEHDGGTGTAYFDLIIVGKYVSPEPAHGAWGTEESEIVAYVDRNFTLTIGTYTISDITRDAGGDVIGNCTVQLFRTLDKAFITETTSSASGAYSFTVNSKVRQHFLIGYKSGTPNRFGASDRNVLADGAPSQFWGLRQAFDASPKDVRQYFLQYQTPVDRSFTLMEGITGLVDRNLSVNVRKLALNDRTLTMNVELTTANDKSFSLTIEKTDAADRQLNMNVWKSALQDRSVMSVVELFEFLNRSINASIEPTVLIDRNVSAYIEPTRFADSGFSLQSELTSFVDRTTSLNIAGLNYRSLSANIEPYTYVGYEHRGLAVNSELTNVADRHLQIMSELTALVDKTLYTNVERFVLADRSLSLGMEVPGFANAPYVLSVEQTLLKDRNLNTVVELFNSNDKSVSLFVEPTVFADRNFVIRVGTQSLNDRNLVSNVERFLLVDRPLTLSTDKGLDTDRSLALQAERTLFADSQLTTAIELPTISDRSLNLVAEKILLNDRQFILSAEKFGLADSNLLVFVEPTRFSDASLALQSEVTLTADSLLQLNSELFTVSDRNQTVVVELTSLADSSLSVSIELPTVSDRSLSLNVERTFYADNTLTLNSELTLYGDRNLSVNAERTLQTDGLLSLSMEALRYADRPLSLNSEVPFAVQDRNLSVFIEPTHFSDISISANIERFLYLKKSVGIRHTVQKYK